jgi:hypothetical protein
MNQWRVDPWPAVAAVVALGMTGVYLAVIAEQGDGDPAPWYLALLVLGSGAAAYAAVRSAPHARVVLAAAAGMLGVAGLLGILTIGLPILLAAGLCVLSLVRQPRTEPSRA